jgi:hypothetical protein
VADQRRTGAEEDRQKTQHRPKPIPRDMPAQQWHGGPDRWDTPAERLSREDERPDEEGPDTDESGTGKRGRAHSGSVHPEHPVPDEPPA